MEITSLIILKKPKSIERREKSVQKQQVCHNITTSNNRISIPSSKNLVGLHRRLFEFQIPICIPFKRG